MAAAAWRSPAMHRQGGCCFGECTPEAMGCILTTPLPGPAEQSWDLDDGTEAASMFGTATLLQWALSSGHTCGHALMSSHCVHESVRSNSLEALQFLLERKAWDFDEHCHGLRPLHVTLKACVFEGDVGHQMLHLLLQHGAAPHVREGDAFGTWRREAPLHDAARRGCTPALALLLQHGADPNVKDACGNTPLHALSQHAGPWTRYFSGRVLELLLAAGAAPALPNITGLPPSCFALATLLLILKYTCKIEFHGFLFWPQNDLPLRRLG